MRTALVVFILLADGASAQPPPPPRNLAPFELRIFHAENDGARAASADFMTTCETGALSRAAEHIARELRAFYLYDATVSGNGSSREGAPAQCALGDRRAKHDLARMPFDRACARARDEARMAMLLALGRPDTPISLRPTQPHPLPDIAIISAARFHGVANAAASILSRCGMEGYAPAGAYMVSWLSKEWSSAPRSNREMVAARDGEREGRRVIAPAPERVRCQQAAELASIPAGEAYALVLGLHR